MSETEDHGFLAYLWKSLAFVPVFALLLLLGIVKAILIGPIVWLVITVGNSGLIVGLWPCHAFWTYYCIAKTKKFGTLLKSLLFLSLPIPLLLWPLMGVIGSIFAGLGYGLISPLMATFEAIGEGVSNKFVRCFQGGTWSSVLGGCTIVRDFADVCFYSYFSLMDGLLNSKGEMPIEIKKIPQREDYSILFLSYPCLMSTPTISFSCKKGPAFQARPSYRKAAGSPPPRLLLKRLCEPSDAAQVKQPPIRTPSEKMQALKALLIWNNFFKACEHIGKELIGDGAIEISDLEAWKFSKNNIINIGLPAYAFLRCFLRSIKSGSSGFLMSDNVELTNVNRPEGRVFDWLFEPMSIMKEQLRVANLLETEELYLCKLALYCGDAERLETWKNGGVPPDDEVRRAQLEGISRRLHGFSLTLSRLPTFPRRFHEVVKALLQEGQQRSKENNEVNGIEDV